MCGGLVRKEGKYMVLVIMMILTFLGIYVSVTTGISPTRIGGIFLLLTVTYMSIKKTSRLIPEGIRHTWMCGIVFLVIAVALGTPLIIPYAVVGLMLISGDLILHKAQGRTITQHSHKCDMVNH